MRSLKYLLLSGLLLSLLGSPALAEGEAAAEGVEFADCSDSELGSRFSMTMPGPCREMYNRMTSCCRDQEFSSCGVEDPAAGRSDNEPAESAETSAEGGDQAVDTAIQSVDKALDGHNRFSLLSEACNSIRNEWDGTNCSRMYPEASAGAGDTAECLQNTATQYRQMADSVVPVINQIGGEGKSRVECVYQDFGEGQSTTHCMQFNDQLSEEEILDYSHHGAVDGLGVTAVGTDLGNCSGYSTNAGRRITSGHCFADANGVDIERGETNTMLAGAYKTADGRHVQPVNNPEGGQILHGPDGARAYVDEDGNFLSGDATLLERNQSSRSLARTDLPDSRIRGQGADYSITQETNYLHPSMRDYYTLTRDPSITERQGCVASGEFLRCHPSAINQLDGREVSLYGYRGTDFRSPDLERGLDLGSYSGQLRVAPTSGKYFYNAPTGRGVSGAPVVVDGGLEIGGNTYNVVLGPHSFAYGNRDGSTLYGGTYMIDYEDLQPLEGISDEKLRSGCGLFGFRCP